MSDKSFWVGVWLLIGAAFVWQFIANPQQEEARLKWMFGPTRRDYARTAILLPLFFGGPVLAIFALKDYPPLDLRLAWFALAFFVILWVAMFWIWKQSSFPNWVGLVGTIAARGGWALSFTALVLGIIVFVNGYSTPLEHRSAQVVRKWSSRQRDPNNRQYALYVLAWPGSDRVAQVDSSQAVYERVRVGDRVVLTLGVGRLGLEWVRDVAIPHVSCPVRVLFSSRSRSGSTVTV